MTIKRIIARLIGTNSIKAMYYRARLRTSDINEHVRILKRYASRCESVAEFGVRNVVSTWAFLDSRAKRVFSYDIEECGEVAKCRQICERQKRNWRFFKQSI